MLSCPCRPSSWPAGALREGGQPASMAQSLRRRTRRVAHRSRAQTVGLLGDGTHAQATAPALGARRRQAARGNRFVKGQDLFSGREPHPVEWRSRRLDTPPRPGVSSRTLKHLGSVERLAIGQPRARGVRRGNGCSRSAIHRCGRRISRRRRAAPQIAPQRAA